MRSAPEFLNTSMKQYDVVRFARDKAMPFLRGKVIPAIGNVVNSVKGWFE